MAKFSQKVKGKEVGQAGVYAAPHKMSGKSTTVEAETKRIYQGTDPNTLKATEINPRTTGTLRVSAGDPGRDDVKKDGIKIRGTGAATKGLMARGPMG